MRARPIEPATCPKDLVVAGIDVGDCKKGFHMVALNNGAYLDKFPASEAMEAAAWCRRTGAQIIGIDAPCHWSVDGKPRPAERDLMAVGIWCFSTPEKHKALTHPKRYYDWMLNGETLFEHLKSTHPLYNGNSEHISGPFCFETFPQAIACSLAGRIVSAKKKRTARRQLLHHAGVDTAVLSNIDWLDAALCALAAHYFAMHSFKTYGEANSGYIVVPA